MNAILTTVAVVGIVVLCFIWMYFVASFIITGRGEDDQSTD